MSGAGPWLRAARLWLAAVAVVCAGCVTSSPPSADGLRLARFRPDEADRNPLAWPAPPAPAVAATPVDTNALAGVDVASTNIAAFVESSSAKPLRRGDTIYIHLKGISREREEESRYVIDSEGRVNLSLIGVVKVDGLTTSDAERLIEKMYVDGGYYNKITVIIVPQDAQYFVQGEVTRQGKYLITGDLTLLQAIAEAGGYTDFARPSEVKIKRAGKVLQFNCERIAEIKDEDPLIRAGDLIIVPRRWM